MEKVRQTEAANDVRLLHQSLDVWIFLSEL